MPSYQVALILIVVMIGAVIVVLSVLRYRARLAEAYAGCDKAYQKIAQEAVDVQRKVAEDQAKAVECLTELRDRIVAIEKLLREVN